MNKIIHADPHSRKIRFSSEVLHEAYLFVQCINSCARERKSDHERTRNSLLQILIDEIHIAFCERRGSDPDDIAGSQREIHKFNRSSVTSMPAGRGEMRYNEQDCYRDCSDELHIPGFVLTRLFSRPCIQT